MSTYIEQINHIIEHIEIEEDQIKIVNGPSISFYKGKDNYESDLTTKLSEAIYHYFYTKGNTDSGDFNSTEKSNKENYWSERQRYIDQLKEAVESSRSMNKGWLVENRSYENDLLVRKGQYQKNIKPGSYIDNREMFYGGNQEWVDIDTPDFSHADPAFFYVFGNTLTDEYASFLCRLYFSIKPAFAKELIELIQHRLNTLTIPFSFKCLNHPDMYDRADSAVLYIAKPYFNLVWQFLAASLSESQNHFRDIHPLFTLPLFPGVSFAENPPTANESFGSSRSRLIAEGLTKAHISGKLKEDRLNTILEEFLSLQFDLEKLYLNPNSHYPYQFKSEN